jgi:hypothetical protein
MLPMSAVFLAVPGLSGGGMADNIVRQADGAGIGGAGRLIYDDFSVDSALKRLHNDLSYLQEMEAKFGLDVPLRLLNQIHDYKVAINLGKKARVGKISEEEFLEYFWTEIELRHFNTPIIRNLENQADFEPLLLKLHQNHNILLEIKAKFGALEVPLGLQNQIYDYELAIKLAELGRRGKFSVKEFREEISSLILDYRPNY